MSKIISQRMPLSTGTRLGPYEILALIGAGGMGEVYKARDTRLDRVVAIKVCKEQFSQRFEQEARAIATLIRFQVLYVFLVMAHDRRRVVHFNVTAHPTAEWTAQQLREAFPFDQRVGSEGVPGCDMKDSAVLGGRLLRFEAAVTKMIVSVSYANRTDRCAARRRT